MPDKANFINELEKLCRKLFGKEWNVSYVGGTLDQWEISSGDMLEINILVHKEGEE